MQELQLGHMQEAMGCAYAWHQCCVGRQQLRPAPPPRPTLFPIHCFGVGGS